MNKVYLKMAIDLSVESLEANEFPAGAVLVTESGKVYKSKPSLPYYHGECMVIDDAIKAQGYPLKNATLYASMEPCLMCSAKAYWAGCDKVYYVIPKERTNTLYAYEDGEPMADHIKNFNSKIDFINEPKLLNAALKPYEDWVNKIEARK